MPRFNPSSPLTGPRVALAQVASVVLAALAAALLAWWAMLLSAPRPAMAPPASSPLGQADPATAAMLFGAIGGAPRIVAAQRLPAIKVVGVIVHPQRGAALVSIHAAPPRAFAVGETVSPGVTLLAVTADSAVFERAGERIELAAPRRASPELLHGAASAPPAAPGRPAGP